ncbi:MAG: hypothetical protein WDZ52_02590 [Pseudohongiellaceae bacterium]
MRYFIVTTYLLAAAINLAPAIGVFSNAVLTRLYSVEISSPEISLLLRHRAVLFAIVGSLLLAAAFIESLRTQAGIAGLVSMCAFILLYLLSGADDEKLLKVALVDAVVVLLFVVGFVQHLRAANSPRK